MGIVIKCVVSCLESIHQTTHYKMFFINIFLLHFLYHIQMKPIDGTSLGQVVYWWRFTELNTQICWALPRVVGFGCLRNWFTMQGPVAIILISWNVIFIWETGYWTRAMKRFGLFDLLKNLYSDTKILSKYIPSLQKRL